jgi:hypothetical protein
VKKLAIAVTAGFLLLGFVAGFELPWVLFAGWLFYLGRVLPRVSVEWPSVAVGVGAVMLFTAGVHRVGRTWARRPHPGAGTGSRPWRLRWSLAAVAVVFLLFAAGIALVGITHQVSWLLTSPEPLRSPALRYGDGSRMNLRMIGLAAVNYRDQLGRFPPGGSFTADGAMLHSWETYLLPYLSYSTQGIDLHRPWNDPGNAPYFKSILPVFINPGFRPAELTDAEGYGLSHYAANSRVLGGNKAMRLEDITDGLSTTLWAGEVNAQFRPWGHPANFRDPANGINSSPHGFGGPRSSGGATFLMADCSVRFVSERVSPRVLLALSTPDGGEVVEDDPPGVSLP